MNRISPDITEFLSQVAPFSGLDAEAIGDIARRLRIRYYTQGETLDPFDPPAEDGLYILRKGAVALLEEDGQIIEHRGEGEIFGHRIAFARNAGAAYRVRTVEDCLIWHLPAGETEAILGRYRALASFFGADPGQRLREQQSARPRAETLDALPLRDPVTADPETSIASCARLMAEHQVSSLPLITEGRLAGIITDRDLRNRVLACGIDPEQPVSGIMTAEPSTAPRTDRIDTALVEMMRLGIHHLPVVDETGALAAVVSSGDLMRVQSPHPLRLVRDIQRAADADSVAALARQAPQLLAGMARGGAGASEVGGIAGRITDACTRRLLDLSIEVLGPAPMAWAWLAFGSQARLEQGLISDQDNGLLLASAPSDDEAAYFERLAARVCDGLDACGYVFCPGGVMAKGEWRLPLSAWRQRFSAWIREPDPRSVMQSSIFFDLRAVAGDADLANELHTEVVEQARDAEIFRRFLAAESMGHRPPIGVFRQFVQEAGGEQSKGLNLKKRGVIPIVDLARVHALEGALSVIGTEDRIRAAGKAGLVNDGDADDLIHAFRFIGDIRLRHQAAQLERGQRPDHLVDPDELSGLHRRYLRSAFSIVTAAQKALAQRYML
jgi:CBS domain-containing protein